MGQTIRAYISSSVERGRYYSQQTEAFQSSLALAELARILGDVEPAVSGEWAEPGAPGWAVYLGGCGCVACRDAWDDAHAIMAESLADITRDGGELDQLAAEADRDYALSLMPRAFCHDDRHATPCPLPCLACADECEPGDPVIAAAQHDLGVLRAYAAGRA